MTPRTPTKTRRPRARTTTPLPALPSSVHSVHGPIAVTIVEGLTDPDNGAPLFGQWDPMQREISIRAGLHPTAAWLTLWHERTHADLSEIGVDLSHDQHEAISNAIAAARVSEMLAAAPRSGRRRR